VDTPERLVGNRIAFLHQLIAALHERLAAEPVQAAAVLPELLEDLHTALEELHVAEEEQHQQNEALVAARLTAEAERQRYQELFDFAPDGYLVTDADGIIQEANQAAAVLLGVPQPRLLDKPLVSFIAEEGRQAFRAFLPQLQQLEGRQDWEIRLQPVAGATFPAELTVATIRAPQGVVGLRWLLHDISRRKQVEEALKQAHTTLEHRVAERTAELQRMNAQLQAEIAERQRAAYKSEQAEQALRSSREQLRQLATHLQNAQEQERAHIARELHDDLAQALTSIRLDVSWLARRALTAPAEWRERLTTIAATIDTLHQTVSRISTELRPNILDALGLIAAIEWQLQEIQRRTDLTYTLQKPPEESTLDQARATALFRIFQEAVTNIVRHAEASHIYVRLVEHANAVLLEVADNGKGISRRQATAPTSLGLLGMRERARLWGGYMTINGTPELGTTVTTWIPRETVPAEVGTGVTRVLVADDHATVREGIRRFLADTPDLMVAREACAAPELFEAVAAGDCDAVLLDVSLPGRDGLDVLKELKQRYPTLPVLMFSVYAEEQYAIRALKTGAAGYVTKSSEPEVLITALRKVAQGGRYVSASLAERLAMEITADVDKPLHATLANREYQVLLMLGEGKTVKEIASVLALSVKTISTYRTRILHKLHLNTTADLIRYTISQHLLSQPTAHLASA
jgi:two-component system, NarL family, invasion response regulator UvrY